MPGPALSAVEDPGAALMLRPVDLEAMRAEHDRLAAAYRSLGVEVHRLVPSPEAPPNLLFLRDLFLMTPDGALVARTASEQRAGEERHLAAALARIGVPIVGTILGAGTFEGADALWFGPDEVWVGIGKRTNAAGFDQLRDHLARQGVTARSVPLEGPVQHLLGAVTFARSNLAVLHPDSANDALMGALRRHGVEALVLDPGSGAVPPAGATTSSRWLRGQVLMPAGCPGIRRRLEGAGVVCHEVPIPQYLNAAGGVGCLTGILRRDVGGHP